MNQDARGKRCEERFGHDARRFHGHGRLSSILPKTLTMCFTRIGNG